MSWDVAYWVMLPVAITVFAVNAYRVMQRKPSRFKMNAAVYLIFIGTCMWPFALPLYILYLLLRTATDGDAREAGGAAQAGTREGQAFWKTAPIFATDPAVLYQYGIQCVARQDGPGMIATGCALWRQDGLSQNQARDFIQDGFTTWRETTRYSTAEGIRFLEYAFGRLRHGAPSLPPDPSHAPPENMQQASDHLGLRSVIGEWLLEEAARAGRANVVEAYEDDFRRMTAATPIIFVPPLSISRTRAYAADRGIPDPWPDHR